MPDYSKGKIYQIISPHSNLVYIGSTTQPLSVRMAEHRRDLQRPVRCKSADVIEYGDAYIELVEEYPCENREQLQKREGEIMRSRLCVNRCLAGRTKKEYKLGYYRANKTTIRKKHKDYYESNKDSINKKRNEKSTCACGGNYSVSNQARHFKSLKHSRWAGARKNETNTIVVECPATSSE